MVGEADAALAPADVTSRCSRLSFDSVDVGHVRELRKIARRRADLFRSRDTRMIIVGMAPLASSVFLRTRSLPTALPADLSSYPHYLFTKFAEDFPKVNYSNLEELIRTLGECHAR